MKNGKEIVREWLLENGFDGLHHESDCGCKVDDLAPCGECFSECTAGYEIKWPCGCGDWVISSSKEYAIKDECLICGERTASGSSAKNIICEPCAKKNNLCEKCGVVITPKEVCND